MRGEGMNCFLDIESIPTQRTDIIEELRLQARDKHAAKCTKPDSIAAKHKEFDADPDKYSEEYIADTSLDGAFGEVICVCLAIDDGPIQTLWRSVEQSEGELLERFVQIIPANTNLTFIGHNVKSFDSRFLRQRCMVNGVFIGSWVKNYQVFDTMIEWAGRYDRQNWPSLSKLCKAFRIEHDDSFTGADVWPAVKRGDYDSVLKHCEDDVRAVREVWRRMCG